MEIDEKIVVAITGASSGIGRATALKLARDGNSIIGIARNESALGDLVIDCEKLGGHAIAVPIDVTSENDVKDAVRRGIDAFGHIDVWINDAAVSVYGRFDEIPPDEFWRVIQVNLFGYVNGMRAILPHFREQGRGTIINISSVVGKTGQPFTSAYAASKAAVIGLSESVRMELLDMPGIHVCTVMPATVDTPLLQHAANFFGKAIKPMSPVYTPEQVAEAIVKTIKYPRPEVVIGVPGKAISMLHSLAPGISERYFASKVEKEHFENVTVPESTGNLFDAGSDMSETRGGWASGAPVHSRAVKTAGAAALGIATLGAGTLYFLRRRLR